MYTISLKTLFYWYLSKNITIVRSQCPLDVKGSDRDKEDTNGMGFGCHKLVDDRIPENVLEPPSWRNEIADIYPFERSLQVTVLSSVSMEFNSIRDPGSMQLFDTWYFLFPTLNEVWGALYYEPNFFVDSNASDSLVLQIGNKRMLLFYARNQLIFG